MFEAGSAGLVGGVFAGSLKFPSGASQSRNTSFFRNTTRTFAVPAVSVYVEESAAKAVTAPRAVSAASCWAVAGVLLPATRAPAIRATVVPASAERLTESDERLRRTKMLTSASLHASMNRIALLITHPTALCH